MARSTPRKTARVPKFVSFQIAYWRSSGDGGSSYSIFALGEDGCIYRWFAGASQWEELA